MQNLYNAKVSFKGEGSFTFVMPYYGEVTIYAGRDIYMKNLTQQGVEALRALRPVMLDHQLNAKPDGCYTYIDFNEVQTQVPQKMNLNYRQVEQPKSVAQMKAEMIKPTGPIVDDEVLNNVESTEEVKEPIKENKDEVKIEDYILTSTKHKGKRLGDLSKAQINGNLRRFNSKDLEVVNNYLNK